MKRIKLFILVLVCILILFLVVIAGKEWFDYIQGKISGVQSQAKIRTEAEQIKQRMVGLKEEAIETNNPELCKQILDIIENEVKRSWKIEQNFVGHYYDQYDPCIQEIAFNTKNESICNELTHSSVLGERIKECQKKIFLATTDLCNEVSDMKAKEDCIIKMAQDTNNLELCRKMIQWDCVNKISISRDDPDACYKYDYGRIDADCITPIAVNKKDASLCRRLFQEDQVGCIEDTAIKTGSPDFCNLITDISIRERCRLEANK